jgi:hypothetical protein
LTLLVEPALSFRDSPSTLAQVQPPAGLRITELIIGSFWLGLLKVPGPALVAVSLTP